MFHDQASFPTAPRFYSLVLSFVPLVWCYRSLIECEAKISKAFAFFTIYGYITNSQHDPLSVGSIAPLVEHCTGIAEVMGWNPIQA